MARKLPVYLLLDTSGSMKGGPMDALQSGLRTLVNSLRRDPNALESVHLSVITFEREVREVCPLTALEDFQVPVITCPDSGPTHLGAALQMVCTAVRRDVRETTPDRRGDWRPILFVMTDGSPSDTLTFEESLPVLKTVGFASIIACAAGPKARREPLERFADHVVTLDRMEEAAFSSFFQWISTTISSGNPGAGLSPEALSGLPPALDASLARLMAETPPERGFPVVTAGALAALLGYPETAELTAAQSSRLVSALAGAGCHIAPNPLLIQLPPAWSQPVALYRQAEGDGTASARLSGLLRFLYLAVAVTAADGSLDEAEFQVFNQAALEGGASPEDLRHLRATEAALRRDVGVAVAALPHIACGIPPEAHPALLKTLLHLSAADGVISPDELETLRRIAHVFGVDERWLDDWVREYKAANEPPPAQAPPAALQGQASPVPGPLQLDMERINALTRETREVVAILTEVMNGEETTAAGNPPPAPPLPQPPFSFPETPSSARTSVPVPHWFAGLHSRYHKALLFLTGQDFVSMERFEDLARKSHLLADDLFTSVNEWSDEALGDFLLERDQGVRVFRSLLPAD